MSEPLDVLRWEFIQTSYEVNPWILPTKTFKQVIALIGEPPTEYHWLRVESGKALPTWVDSRAPEKIQVGPCGDVDPKVQQAGEHAEEHMKLEFAEYFKYHQDTLETALIAAAHEWARDLCEEPATHIRRHANRLDPSLPAQFVVENAGPTDDTGLRTDVVAANILNALHWFVPAVIEQAHDEYLRAPEAP